MLYAHDARATWCLRRAKREMWLRLKRSSICRQYTKDLQARSVYKLLLVYHDERPCDAKELPSHLPIHQFRALVRDLADARHGNQTRAECRGLHDDFGPRPVP